MRRHGGGSVVDFAPFAAGRSAKPSRESSPLCSSSDTTTTTADDDHVDVAVTLTLTIPTPIARPLPHFDPSVPSAKTASSSHPQEPRNLSPLAAKDPPSHHPPGSHLAVPQPLYHPPASSGIAQQSKGRPNFFPFRGSPSGSRLWNPINYVPRTTLVTPRPPQFSDENLPLEGSSRDAYPLLTISEQRRSRQTPSPASLVVERAVEESESGRTSIGLPRSQQRRSGHQERSPQADPTEMTTGDARRAPDDGVHHPPRHAQSVPSLRASTVGSHPSGTGPNNGEVAEELAWGPAHPCFPHMNPHVPITSEEYTTTRIIRIRRDWMVKGDLAPTFSNLYPEILDPLLPEQEFRRIIAKINGELIKAFDPFSFRNWFDGAMGLLTGWLWDDLGLSGIKSSLRRLEEWLEKWNREVGAKEGVRIWSLRRTAYMTLDIQIPDPKVGLVTSEGPSAPGTRPNSGIGPGVRAAEAHDR